MSKQHQTKGPLRDPVIDDVKGFAYTEQSLSHIGLDEQERMNIYGVVAAVLHLGNIKFEDDPEDSRGGCKISSSSLSELSLTIAANLIGVDKDELRSCLLSRVMQTTKGGMKGTVIMLVIYITY